MAGVAETEPCTAEIVISIVFSIDYRLIALFAWDIDEKAQKVPEVVEKALFSCWDAIDAHVRAEDFRDPDGAVGLLKILNNCNPSAAHGESRTVQSVHEVAFAAAFRFEADPRASRLKGFAIGTRRDFAKFIARR